MFFYEYRNIEKFCFDYLSGAFYRILEAFYDDMMLNSSTSKAKLISTVLGSNHEPARKRVNENANESVAGVFLRQLPNRNRGQQIIKSHLVAVSVSDISQLSASNSDEPVSEILIRQLPDRKRGKQKVGCDSSSIKFFLQSGQ